MMLTKANVNNALTTAGKEQQWSSRLSATGSGSEIFTMLESTGSVSAKIFTSWWYFESAFDDITNFLNSTFVGSEQLSKIHYDITGRVPKSASLLIEPTGIQEVDQSSQEVRILLNFFFLFKKKCNLL
jgi:hypothetical protein